MPGTDSRVATPFTEKGCCWKPAWRLMGGGGTRRHLSRSRTLGARRPDQFLGRDGGQGRAAASKSLEPGTGCPSARRDDTLRDNGLSRKARERQSLMGVLKPRAGGRKPGTSVREVGRAGFLPSSAGSTDSGPAGWSGMQRREPGPNMPEGRAGGRRSGRNTIRPLDLRRSGGPRPFLPRQRLPPAPGRQRRCWSGLIAGPRTGLAGVPLDLGAV